MTCKKDLLVFSRTDLLSGHWQLALRGCGELLPVPVVLQTLCKTHKQKISALITLYPKVLLLKMVFDGLDCNISNAFLD